jgi:hypothetical protein
MLDEAKRRVTIMHAVMRNYSGKGAKELFEILDKHKSDVEGIMRSIKGFVSYTIVHTDVGGFTLSVFQDKAGTDESVRKAGDWVREQSDFKRISDTF